jgi:UTP--glucose-1-phosphate uridylyltransferase
MIPAMTDLDRDLASLDASLRARLDAVGFSAERLRANAASLRGADGALLEPTVRRRDRNVVRGEVRGPSADELTKLPPAGSEARARLAQIGQDALSAGELAFCTMAGGMATRMGGVVKALAEVFDGKTFLDLRLGENKTASERAGKPVPLWLMTSDATDAAIREGLAARKAPPHIKTFVQQLSLRLDLEGRLFRDAKGEPSTHATGHGDLVDALRRSKLLDGFIAGGGKYVWITNVDNLGATMDTALLGHFIESGKQVMVEVCRKVQGDRGGIPVHAEGRLQVLEEFRLPEGFDASTVQVFNTNTFLCDARALRDAPLTWTFFEVEKKVDGAPALQFERLLQELTAHLDSGCVEVPREGAESRFLPVKDFDELAARREAIQMVARARGMV